MTAATRAQARDVRYGRDAILRAPDVVIEVGGRRVLVVCGTRSFEASGAARMLPSLERAATVRLWRDFGANPDAAELAQGLGVVADFRPDLVLGVGGGSAMDMAKLLCAFADLPDRAALPAAIRAGRPIGVRSPRLVLAPTTSGSGSEATHFAVVYVDDEKFSVAGESLRPDVVILDPVLSMSGSAYQRATSGVDAIAQAIESLWAAAATDLSRRWARHALGLLLPAIEGQVDHPDEEHARAMAIGSHLAGRAIDISRTTAAHALSYAITKRYGISHGHAVGLTLGAFIEAHGQVTPDRLQAAVDPRQHAAAMAQILECLGVASARDARHWFAALLRRIGLDPSLHAAGARTAADRRAIAAAANPERLGNNPARFTVDQLAELVEGIECTSRYPE